MSHYLTIPINANGIIVDQDMDDVIAQAIAPNPFGFSDVYIYSHGWSTDATQALDEYNRFSIDLSKRIAILGQSTPAPFARPPSATLGVGIHWPSEMSEDSGNILNKLQVLSFYTMEKRADAVGMHGVYSIIRLMLQARAATPNPIRFNLFGHSFGCKVVCAALNDIAADLRAGQYAFPNIFEFNVVLLQAATNQNDLEKGGCYGGILDLPSRVLATFSGEDRALNEWFVDAGKLANLFHSPRKAIGAVGPTAQTLTDYASAGSAPIVIGPGFTHAALRGNNDRLVVADLSPLHKAHPEYPAGLSGHHSDINRQEVYELISGFVFGVN